MLTEPTRNNYYYGKLLDVGHLQLEQDYGKQKRWLLNRLTLGPGVLCGLEVSVVDDKLRVGAGVAVDPFGREIVVPGTFPVDPFAPAPTCHGAGIDPDRPGVVTLWLCYRECLADYSAALVSSCHGQERCEAGAIIESFSLHVAAGVPDRPPSDLCDRLCAELTKGTPKDPVDPARLLCELVPSGCPEPPAQDCVALATVEVLEGRHLGDVDECAVRTRIYSQPVLMELITCLMTKVAACCPSTLRVDTVAVFTVEGQDRELVTPDTPVVVPAGLRGQGFEVRFSRAVDPATVTTLDDTTTADQATVLVVRREPEGPGTPVPGMVGLPAPDTARWEPADGTLEAGATYDVTLFGDATDGRPVIHADDDAERLDGEPLRLPSGDGTEGGDFTFVITCEAVRETVLKVAGVQMAASAAAPDLKDPGTPILVASSAEPTGFRVTFTEDVDQATVTAFQAVPEGEASLLIGWVGDGRRRVVDGDLEWETPRRVRWRINQDVMPPGHYDVRLFGDATPTRPAIAGTDGRRLDGEPSGLPSGDGTEGGSFRFAIDVQAEDRPLEVAEVQIVMTSGDGPQLEDPKKGVVVASVGDERPRGFRVTFTRDVDRNTASTWPEVDVPNATVVVERAGAEGQGAVPGALDWESPRVMVWTIRDPDTLPPATYEVTLVGDPSEEHGAIAEPDGHRLDGEPVGLPSGTGVEGGDFTFTIVVAIP